MRWQHPSRGLLLPNALLPLIEHTGLMRPLTWQVLSSAVEQAAQWMKQGLAIPVAVNFSAPDLIDANLASEVRRQLTAHRLEPEMLEVEVTEGIIATDRDRVSATLASLRELGVTIALDDFGTGSSSLSYLRRLPVQVLKIDRSFISSASTGDPADVALVRTSSASPRPSGCDRSPKASRLGMSANCSTTSAAMRGRALASRRRWPRSSSPTTSAGLRQKRVPSPIRARVPSRGPASRATPR